MKLIYILPVLIVFTYSCRKGLKEETVITVRCVKPHNGGGIAGCKVTVYEIKSKKEISVTGSIDGDVTNTYTATTNENGNATIRFHYMRKSKYQYKLAYDYSGIEQPDGMDEIEIVTPRGWATYLDKNQFEYNFTFNVLGSCHIHSVYENIDCYDENDKLEVEFVNLSEHYTLWENGPFYFSYSGCGITHNSTTYPDHPQKSGIYAYRLRITKNNISTIRYDTIVFYPNTINEAIIEY